MKRIVSLSLFALLLLSLAVPVMAAESATGTTLRLEETSGEVNVKSPAGQEKKVIVGMRLYNGHTLETGADSRAYVSLDDTKVVELGSSGKAEVRKSGKKLEIALTAGQLYFNVTKPLNADESLNIRTSTMVTGVRGSFGWVTPTEIGLMHGYVLLLCADPKTGETRITVLHSGEMVSFEGESARSGAADDTLPEIGFVKKPIGNEDVPAAVIAHMREDSTLRAQVEEDVASIDVPALLESLPEKEAEEGEEEAKALAEAEQAIAAQKQTIAATVQSGSGTSQDYVILPAETAQPGGGSGGGSGSSGSGSSSSGSGKVSVEDASLLANALSNNADVTFTGKGTADALMIGSGKTLTVASGAELTLSGESVNRGTVHNNGELAVSGTLDNLSANTINNNAVFTVASDAVFRNGGGSAGVFANNGSVSVAGKFINMANGSITGTPVTGSGVYYTVSFDANGGSEVSSQEVAYGSAVSEPDAPSSESGVFNGWYAITASAETLYSFSSPVTGNLTLRAGWAEASGTRTVSFESNGGSTVDSQTVDYGGKAAKPADPTKNGNSFGGWYHDAALTEAWSFESDTVLSDTMIYAKWIPDRHTITFAGEDGETLSTAEYDYGTPSGAITAPAAPEKAADERYTYSFSGWSPEVADVTGDATYTAIYVPAARQYALSYELDGGALADGAENPANYTFESADITLTNPSRTGYTFAGWTGTDLSGATATVTIPTGSTGNRSYTATWTADSYTLSYELDGGSATNPTSYTIESADITLANPTKTGYTFAGWTGTDLSGATSTVTIPAGSTGNRGYTATWRADSYTLSYELNGGSATNPTSYTIESADITLTNPTKTGYTFAGWTGTGLSEATTSVTIPTGSTGNRSYTATWTADSYTLSYELNGGSATNPTSYTIESEAITLTNPTKTGYTFAGWTESDDGTATTAVTIPTGSTGNRSYTATWTADSYTLSYDLDGGSATNPTSYTVESEAITLTNPTKTGYTFAGWTGTDLSEATTAVTIPTGSTGNRSYTATWTADSYTLSYELNGGSATNPTSYTIESEAITLTNPTRTGYTFGGWTGTGLSEATTAVTIPAGSTGNRSYTATWTADSYTLSYELNGGSATNPASYTVESEAITLMNPTKTGYTFGGWTGTGLSEATTAVTIPTGSTGNRSYTATWTADSYTLSYELNGGSATNPASYTVESEAITLMNPTKTGYTFAGWTGTDLSGATATVTIPAGSTGNRGYTATWRADSYTLSYELDGGSATNPTSYTIESADITLANPTKTGYTFAGWTGTDLSGATATVTIPAGSTGNRGYTATWRADSYTLSYELNGGSATNPASYTLESEAITLTNPTKTGYTFAGWTGTGLSGATTAVTIPTGSTGNRSYTATWTADSYTLSYELNGGSATNPASYTVESEAITLMNPTKTGYTFAGWTGTGLSGATTAVTIPTGSTGNRSYTATWTADSYTLSYELNGGSATNPTSYTIESEAITLTNPTKTGYTFAGWTGTDLSEATTAVTIPTGSTGNRSYTATWTADSYTLSYDLDGGSATNPTSYTIESEAITLTNPTKTGYTFAGWTGTDLSEATTSVTILTGSTGNRSYTATWTADSYTLSYELNGGSATNPTSYTIESADITLTNPTRTGYTFAGWTGTDLSGATSTVTIPAGSTGNRGYTATWRADSYTLSYELNGGSATNPTSYTIESADITLANPTKTGYTFAGWTGTDLSEATTAVTIPAGSTGNRGYTATWRADSYTLSYELNGGSATNPTSYTVESEAITLTNPTKTGYTFAGWTGTDLSEATTAVTIPTGSTGNRSYTATWTADSYTLSYDLDGGSATNPTSYTIESEAITLTNPTKTGYTFAGWTGTDLSGATATVTIPTGSTGNRSYTATWTLPTGVTGNNVSYAVTKNGSDEYYSLNFSLAEGQTSGTLDDFTDAADQPWNNYASQITGVQIGSGITRIGNYSFSGLTALQSVTVPESVTEIGVSAFDGCTALSRVTIMGSLSELGNNVFNNTVVDRTGVTGLQIEYNGALNSWASMEIGTGAIPAGATVSGSNDTDMGKVVTQVTVISGNCNYNDTNDSITIGEGSYSASSLIDAEKRPALSALNGKYATLYVIALTDGTDTRNGIINYSN